MAHRVAYCMGLVLLLNSLPLAAQPALVAIEKTVALVHPVPNIAVEELKEKLASGDSAKLVLFDTRRLEEYKISHIRLAIQLNPDMAAKDFIKKYGAEIKGKQVVFYCSVGYRSSIFVERVQERALAGGVLSLANLRGGIFRWYNEGNALVDQRGETDAIHPYDRFWGRLIKERDRRGGGRE